MTRAVSVGAWLLPISNKQNIAVAEYQMYEYVVSAQTADVPLAPPFCQKMMFWQEKLVPIITLDLLFDSSTCNDPKGYVIVAYQAAPKAAIQYAGLAVSGAPYRITVEDEAVTELPGSISGTLQYAIQSCFLYKKKPVPILNIAYVCSKEFRIKTVGY